MTHILVLSVVMFVYLHLWFLISVIRKNFGLVDIAWGLELCCHCMDCIYTNSNNNNCIYNGACICNFMGS